VHLDEPHWFGLFFWLRVGGRVESFAVFSREVFCLSAVNGVRERLAF